MKEPCYEKLIECIKVLYAPKVLTDPYEWEESSKGQDEVSEENTNSK